MSQQRELSEVSPSFSPLSREDPQPSQMPPSNSIVSNVSSILIQPNRTEPLDQPVAISEHMDEEAKSIK